MNIYLIIFLPLIIFMFFNFKKSFLIFAFFKIILNSNINLVNLPGVPLLTLELVCNLCFAFYFFSIKKSLNKGRNFPLLNSFLLILISLFLSTIFSTVGFGSAITRTIKIVFNDLIFVYLLWSVLSTIKDIQFIIKGFLVMFLFLTIYGFVEKITGLNPINDYNISLNENGGQVTNWEYSEDGRLGMGRVRSAIIHPIGLGVCLAGLLFLFYGVIINYRRVWRLNAIKVVIVFLLGICVLFFTNSRSPLVFFGIIFLSFLNFNKKSTYQYLFMGMVVFSLGYSNFEIYLENITSLFSANGSSENVGGSNIEMRINQFVSALNLLDGYYLLGLGIKSLQDLYGNDSGILGAESIWISLAIERGFLGVLAHIVFLISVLKMGIGRSKLPIWFFTIGWLILTTISSTPGCGISFFLTIIIILSKLDILTKQNIKIKRSFNIIYTN